MAFIWRVLAHHLRLLRTAPFPPYRSKGIWKGAGVLGPEVFDPIPFMDRMADYGFPWGIMDVKPAAAVPAASAASDKV